MPPQREPWRPPTSLNHSRTAAAPFSSNPGYHQSQQSHHYQQQQQEQQQPTQPADEANISSIPQLTTIAPAIFVEINSEELTAPFTPPATRLQRVESKLSKINSHSRIVRENCLTLYRQECLRHIQNTHLWERDNPDRIFEAHEPAAGAANRDTRMGLDLLVQNMGVGFDDSVEGIGGAVGGGGSSMYRRPSIAELNQQVQMQMQMQTQAAPEVDQHPYSRQALVKDLERTINQGLVDLDSFEGHIEGIKVQYRELYEREVVRDRELEFN